MTLHRKGKTRNSLLHWEELSVERKRYTFTDRMKYATNISVDMIQEFEIDNISVNIFGYDENEVVFPMQISNRQSDLRLHADLFLLSIDEQHRGRGDY